MSTSYTPFEQEMLSTMKAFQQELISMRTAMHSGFEQVDKRFEQVDKRFDQVDKRFEQMDQKFEQVDQRFGQMDQRFEQSDKRFGTLESRMERIEESISDLRDEVRAEWANTRVLLHQAFTHTIRPDELRSDRIRPENPQFPKSSIGINDKNPLYGDFLSGIEKRKYVLTNIIVKVLYTYIHLIYKSDRIFAIYENMW